MFLGILLGCLLELLWIRGQLLRNFFLQGMIRLRILQQGIDRQQAVFRIERRAPLSQYGPTDFSRFSQDGWMINSGLKLEDGRFEGILRGKFQPQNEFSTRVG